MIKPFSRITTIDMWTDPHIQQEMLKHHLSFENDIASRKLETIKKTTEFITSYLGNPVTICDYGCGPGLYTNFLQLQGHTVIGVDISSTSLDYARTQNKNVNYIQMNYITNRINQPIDAAMMICWDLGALKPEDLDSYLSNLSNVLQPNGLFFVDVFSINRFNKLNDSTNQYQETDGFFMDGTATITNEFIKYPTEHITLSHDFAIGEKTMELYNWDRHYDVDTFTTLMNNHGFDVIDVYSDAIRNKDFTNNDYYLFVCQKRS